MKISEFAQSATSRQWSFSVADQPSQIAQSGHTAHNFYRSVAMNTRAAVLPPWHRGPSLPVTLATRHNHPESAEKGSSILLDLLLQAL